MRRRPRTDANQPGIVKALRKHDVLVVSLAGMGHGIPDLLCAYRDRLFLLEVKDGSKCPSARKLTVDEAAFHAAWGSVCTVVNDEAEALAAVGVHERNEHESEEA